MSFDLQSIAQAALDMASLPNTDQETQNSEEKSSDLGIGSVQSVSYKSPTVSDEEEDGNDHLPSQHVFPGPETRASEHNEAGTPPTQAEVLEAPTSQVHEIEDSEEPVAIAVVDFAATAETPVPQSQDNSVDALFDVYDDYESQLDESPNQSGTSQAESSDELFVRQPSTPHESNTDVNTNGGNSDDQTAPLPPSPAVSVTSVENRAAGTQPELNEQSDSTTIQNRETTEEHEENLQISSVASQVSTLPNEEAQLGPQVESVSDDHDQASQEEIEEPIDQSKSDARQSNSQEPEVGSKVPVAHMELSFEENPDQDINREIEPLTPPDHDQSQTEEIPHWEPIKNSSPISVTESTEIVSQIGSQPSEDYADGEAESRQSTLEVASDPVTRQEVTEQTQDDQEPSPKQEVDEEKSAIPEYRSPRLKVESPPREVKDEETPDSPEPPAKSELDGESPVRENEPQPVDMSPTPEQASPEQRQEETPKPRARKPLPTGPLLNRPQKARPAPKAPRKRKLGIYDYFYESDPENWPKKSRIARPQPDDKPRAKKAAAKTSKKRSREEQEEEAHEAATASDASDDKALAVKKREPKKPRGASKVAKEPKVATEKKKRGPKPGAKKPGPKKKKTEELSKPIVESDFDNDSEFVVEANNEDHSEDE